MSRTGYIKTIAHPLDVNIGKVALRTQNVYKFKKKVSINYLSTMNDLLNVKTNIMQLPKI
jgi:hypothetical protein